MVPMMMLLMNIAFPIFVRKTLATILATQQVARTAMAKQSSDRRNNKCSEMNNQMANQLAAAAVASTATRDFEKSPVNKTINQQQEAVRLAAKK